MVEHIPPITQTEPVRSFTSVHAGSPPPWRGISILYGPSCHTGGMAENEDIKERMRKALEAKKGRSRSSSPGGPGSTDGKVHEHADRAGGKREFRRKSG